MKLNYTSRLGWPLLLLLSFVPIIIWAFTPYALPERFMTGDSLSLRKSMQAIGQALGLVGLAMFALNFVLGARLQTIESLFGGMNKVYIAHHILGGLSFILLLLHPLFLIGQFALSGGAGLLMVMKMFVANPACFANFSLFNVDCSTLWGTISLLLMIVFLILTFFYMSTLPYQIWKLSHKFLGLAFFFGALHALLIPSDIVAVALLKYYMFSLVALGVLALCYRTIFGFLMVPRLEYIVDAVEQVNPTIVEITLRPKKDHAHVQYQPGQFIFVGFPDTAGLEEVHPFSLSSAPTSSRITFAAKALGDYTKKLSGLAVGARALVEGPFGRTSYVYYPKKKQIWIAGGIGITPFLGMARSLKPDDGYEIDLYYSAATAEDAAFDAELQSIANMHPNFRLVPWYGKEKGFLSADAIISESKGVLDKEIFLCGPPGMMKALKEQFAKWKVSSRTIHSEEFSMT